MGLRTRAARLLIVIPFLVFAFDEAPESDLQDIRQAAANLHSQILKEKQDLEGIAIDRLPGSVDPSSGVFAWTGPETQALATIDMNRVPTGFEPSLGPSGWADPEKQPSAAIDMNRIPISFDHSRGPSGWAGQEKQPFAAVDTNRVPDSFDPSVHVAGRHGLEGQALAAIGLNRIPSSFGPLLDAVGGADLGNHALAAIDSSRLPGRFVPPLGGGGLDPESELQLAASQQLHQAMEHQRLPEREGPTISTISEQLRLETERMISKQRLAASQSTSTMSEQLRLEADGLTSKQRLAASQLDQAGVVALRSLGKSHAGSAESARRIPSSERSPDRFAQKPPERSTDRSPKQPLALPQTAAKNPAIAALLLEPVLYGYSAVVWALMVLCTGVASAAGLHISKSIALWHEQNLQLPTAGDRSRQFSNDVPTRPNALDEEDVESVESWIKVPVHMASQSRLQDCPGYVDDEFDGGGGSFPMPTTGRHHHRGYVDEH